MVFDLCELHPSTGVLWVLYSHKHRHSIYRHRRASPFDTCLPRVEPLRGKYKKTMVSRIRGHYFFCMRLEIYYFNLSKISSAVIEFNNVTAQSF